MLFFIEGNRDGARTIHASIPTPVSNPLVALKSLVGPSIFLLRRRLLAEFFSTFSLPVCKSFAREGRPRFSSSSSSFFFSSLKRNAPALLYIVDRGNVPFLSTIRSKARKCVYIFGGVIDSFWIFIGEAFRCYDDKGIMYLFASRPN